MELSREEEYERLQSQYVRYETIAPSNSPITIQSKQTEQLIETIATIKNEIVIPLIEVENLNEKIENTVLCETCGGRYSHFNKNRHIATKKHQNATLLSFPPSPLLVREQVVEGSSP